MSRLNPSADTRFLFRLALGVWVVATLLRFWNVSEYAGLNFDDAAYAASGRGLVEEGGSTWADMCRPFGTWFVAVLHVVRGVSVVNVGIAFAVMRSLGELFLILAARRLFPATPWAPLWAAALSASSFLGMNYGKQHMASLLGSVPLALWLYARWIETGRWRDWFLCSVASGLVFLGHYNTLVVLPLMLGLEMTRLLLARGPLTRVGLVGLSGAAMSFLTVTILGMLSYGLSKPKSYITRVWDQISRNQHSGGAAQLSDGFLGAFLSWEGLACALYMVAVAWWVKRMWREPAERRMLALVVTPLLGCAMIVARVNAGLLSFPRLYVFAFPFLWLLAAGLLAHWTTRMSPSTRRAGWAVALLALGISASHQAMARQLACPNAAMEAYFQSHPTEKIVSWYGNPHLATFWFTERWRPLHFTKEEAEADWAKFAASKASARISKRLLAPDQAIWLQRRDLASVCDLVVLQNMSMDSMRRCDAMILRHVPKAHVMDFYNGAQVNLAIQAEDDALAVEPSFTETTPLPLVRVYDLRGE